MAFTVATTWHIHVAEFTCIIWEWRNSHSDIPILIQISNQDNIVQNMVQTCWFYTNRDTHYGNFSHRIRLSIRQAISHLHASSQREVCRGDRWRHCASHTSTKRTFLDCLYPEDFFSSCGSKANNDRPCFLYRVHVQKWQQIHKWIYTQ